MKITKIAEFDWIKERAEEGQATANKLTLDDVRFKAREYMIKLKPLSESLKNFETLVDSNVTGEDADVQFEENYNALSEADGHLFDAIEVLRQISEGEI